MTKHVPDRLKIGVNGVIGVKAFIHAAFQLTPRCKAGVIGVNAAAFWELRLTPITQQKHMVLTRKPAWPLGLTPLTPLTPPKTGLGNENRRPS